MSGDDAEETSIEDTHRDILRLRNRLETMVHGIDVGDFTPGRRGALKLGGAAIVGGGAMKLAGSAAADDGSASGEIGSAANPALKVYTDVFHFHERTSDPSSPDGGTMWYNSSA